MWWDRERIDWYMRAASRTDFHRHLATAIENHLGKDERILELGCGLGYISRILADDGYAIKATDSNEEAILAAASMGHPGIFHPLDAEGPISESDALLMIFFGRLREEGGLRHYLERTKRIVYVISEHRGQSDDLRKNGMEPEATMAYLGSLPDIAFTAEHFEADFHQPLKDRKEALRYIERMYGSGNAERYMAFLRDDGDGLLLPNHKHATVFTIERRSV